VVVVFGGSEGWLGELSAVSDRVVEESEFSEVREMEGWGEFVGDGSSAVDAIDASGLPSEFGDGTVCVVTGTVKGL
jgi:hypothetical protein